jgi:hypothetical protein
MKQAQHLLFVFLLLATVSAQAQVGIGSTPAASAQLDVSSTTKGFLPPRLTYNQRNLITSPATGLILWCSDCGLVGEFQFYNGSSWNALAVTPSLTPFPVLTTSSLSNISSTSAVSGGNITARGNTPVTARGVCWSTSPNPTVALPTKTSDGTGGGVFVSNITGLTVSTTYYVRAYATNSFGTSYGNELSFTAFYSIGESALGGKIAYILQPGDPGYIAGQFHGLVAAPSDQPQNPIWGCRLINIPGAAGTALGTGNQNTIDIIAACATPGIAARQCGNLVLNGFSDWFLPSIDELQKLYINRVAIGGFTVFGYWSSTDDGGLQAARAWSFGIIGRQYDEFRNLTLNVRAVRAF